MKKYKFFITQILTLFSLFLIISCEDKIDLEVSKKSQEITSSISILPGVIMKSESQISVELSKNKNYESAKPDYLKFTFRDPATDALIYVEERVIVIDDEVDLLEDDADNPILDNEDNNLLNKNINEGFHYNDYEDYEDSFVDNEVDEKATAESKEELKKKPESSLYLEKFFIPELFPGLYTVGLEVYEEGILIIEESIPLYINMEEPNITGIGFYPSIAYPGGDAKFTLNATNLNNKSFIVWSINGEKTFSSNVEEGGLDFYWDVPLTQKTYELTAEVYPLNPFFYNFDFESQYKLKTSCIVSNQQLADQNEFYETPSYSSLYHFRGETTDVYGNKDLSKFGKFYVGAYKGLNGYKINRDAYLYSDLSLLPLGEKFLDSFTLSIKLDFKSLNEGVFYSAEDVEGNFSFYLGINENEELYSKINIEGREYYSEFFKIKKDFAHVLSFSLGSYKDRVWLNAYQNGLMLGYKEIIIDNFMNDFASLNMDTKIFGFHDVIFDELGVYVKDEQGLSSVKEDVFTKFALGKNINKVYYVDSFDRIDLSENDEQYSVYLGLLHPGKEAYWFSEKKEILFSNNLLIDLLEKESSMDGLIISLSSEASSDFKKEYIEFKIDEDQVFINNEPVMKINSEGNLELSFKNIENSLYIPVLNGHSIEYFAFEAEGSYVKVEISDCKDNASLLIDTIMLATPTLRKDLILNGHSASLSMIE